MIAVLNTQLRRVPLWSLYLLGMLPLPWLFWQGVSGALGPDPVKALEHAYGSWALKLLILGLMITPARRHLGLNLLRYRRAIGVLSFLYVLAHLTVWALLDVQTLDRIWADILKRPYVTIGMGAALLLLPLALSSNDWALRRLGGLRWRRLHRLVYPAVILSGVHFVWLVKGWQLEPMIYLSVILFLLGLRLPGAGKRRAAA